MFVLRKTLRGLEIMFIGSPFIDGDDQRCFSYIAINENGMSNAHVVLWDIAHLPNYMEITCRKDIDGFNFCPLICDKNYSSLSMTIKTSINLLLV